MAMYTTMDHIVCRYFNTPGGCRYGVRCRYKHISKKKNYREVLVNNISKTTHPVENNVCKLYLEGNCILGNRCKDIHIMKRVFSSLISICTVLKYHIESLCGDTVEKIIEENISTTNGLDLHIGRITTLCSDDSSFSLTSMNDIPCENIEKIMGADFVLEGNHKLIEHSWERLLYYFNVNMLIEYIDILPMELRNYLSRVFITTYSPIVINLGKLK